MPARLVAERYELRELLGQGGMGFVYRGIDTRTGGLVAIKTLRDVSDSRSLDLFKKEWKVLARLAHPNIVDIRDVDEIEEDGVRKPCFIMPLLSGLTLAQIIKDASSRLTVTRVVGIVSQVCNGLEAAHKIELIHRDLKPSNIFVMEDDTAKVIDFGLVHDADINSFAGFKGTFPYASPEQIDDKPLTPESDIYSLAVVAYEALTGRSPFKRPTTEATKEAVRTHHPPAISELNPKVSQLVSKVIHKAMAKQPSHRYSSAKAFGETLQKAYRNEPIERFDPARILPRIERARKAFERDDCAFASEILSELEAEGNVDPEITLLCAQINESVKQKRVRQLFEAAQSRLEQEEIPLALDRIRELLEIDPHNAEALSLRKRIEEQRSNEQISKWMKLARQHIETHDFQEARQAVQEILNIRYDDSEALHLLSDIDAQEKEAVNARKEKEQLYGSALRAYQGGEISNALSQLERILDVSRRSPGATVPERDAVYQSFYNRVRSERDSIDKAYEDGRKYLNDKEFPRAVEICNQMLERYPASAQFAALKLKIEQSERQELSSYIAEIARSVDSEPDLDRRVSILEEAGRRYPNEQQFHQSLRLAREQRDLVNSILAKSRQYEEQSQFADAISQWKILRNIHPQYPGIDFEIAQMEKRREQHSAEEKKVRFVEQIDRAIANGAYGKAVETAGYALKEFPQDPELAVLEQIACKGLERTREAENFFERARKARTDNRYEEAIDLLKNALDLDEHNGGIRSSLVSLLVERAHSLLDEDWRKAEPLVQVATELDSNHPAVKRLRILLDDARRKDAVMQIVADARHMQFGGNVRGALDLIGEGLTQFPEEQKLKQFHAKLRNTLSPNKEAVAAPGDRPVPNIGSEPNGEGGTNPFAPSIVEPNSFTLEGRSIAEESLLAAPPPVQLPEQTVETKPVVQSQPVVKPAKPSQPTVVDRLASIDRKTLLIFGSAAAAILLAIVIGYKVRNRTTVVIGPQRPAVSTILMSVNLSPTDAELKIDGNIHKETLLKLDPSKKYNLAISHPGYLSQTRTGVAPNKTGWHFQLIPEPLRLQVISGERAGIVALDGSDIWNLREGDLNNYAVPADGKQHILTGRTQTGETFKVAFQADAANLPHVESLNSRNLVLGTSFGNEGRVYSASRGSVTLPGQAAQPLTPVGTDVNLVGADGDQAVLSVVTGPRKLNFALIHGNAPILSVLLGENPNVGTLVVDSSQTDARLFVDELEKTTAKAGHWKISGLKVGPHTIRAIANGFTDVNLQVVVERGKENAQTLSFVSAGAFLVITDGPPGAEVVVDGIVNGTLDASGNFRHPLTTVPHGIELRHEGFESLNVRRAFSPGQNVSIPGHDLLRPYGSLQFDVTPPNASVTYRRDGESETHSGSVSGLAKVKSGTYVISARANNYISDTVAVSVVSGETAAAKLQLKHEVVIEHKETGPYASAVTQDGQWFTGAGKVVDLKPGSSYSITFLRPGRVPLKRRSKKAEFRILTFPDAEINYELDGQHLSKIARRQPNFQQKTNIPMPNWTNEQVTVQIVIQEHKITVSIGDAKDEFVDLEHSWSAARISLRGDQYFRVIGPQPMGPR